MNPNLLGPLVRPAKQVILQSNRDQIKSAVANLCATNFLVFQKIELGFEIAQHHKEWWRS